MDDFLDYGKFVDEAMHYVVRKALMAVQEHGLPVEHHFFITFDTSHPGVMIADDLREKYPDEMTIVMQHQFWDMEVDEERFSLVLSFDGVKQNLTVPFNALISFADPSVKFGLQFHHEIIPPDSLPSDADVSMVERNGTEKDSASDDLLDGATNNVVALDSFRKK